MLIVISLKQTPSSLFQVAFFATLVWCVLLPLHSSSLGLAQSAPTKATAESLQSLSVEQKVSRYKALVEAMRAEIKVTTEAKLRFYLDGVEASYDWKDKWEAAVEAIKPLRDEFEMIATDLFLNAPDDPSIPESLPATMFVVRLKLMETDRDADKITVLRQLMEIKPEIEQLKMDLGLVLLKTNQFAEANELIDSIPRDTLEDLTGADSKILAARSKLHELLTTKGPVVIELFENEAPDTVGNFIHLVESGFYTDIIFHRVISGFMAQTGLVARMKTGYVNKERNYTIYDETRGGRRHFSGYLSMAKSDKPDSGSSQFFITYEPTNYLDGGHTVFGRVIEGMENVGRLHATFVIKETEKDQPPEEVNIESVVPDRILNAKVIRKRDHEYVPNKVTTN